MTLPFCPSQIRSARVIAPHPDDECIGAFGLICRLVRGGARVEVIVVTDGSASHPGSTLWPADRLRRARQSEVRAAMGLAGLCRSNLQFLNYPDGQLRTLSGAGKALLARRLAKGRLPDLVICPSLSDVHPDHRMVAEACRDAWPPHTRRLTYQVWPAGRKPPGARAMLVSPDHRRKQAALRLYRTQTGAIRDDPEGFFMDRRLLRIFSGPSEYFGGD